MSRWFALTALLAVLLMARVAIADDNEALQGVWAPATAELGGQKFPEPVRKALRLAVKDGKYTVTSGKSVDQGTVKLDPTTTPKSLDITGTAGPNKGKTILAIYELDGDTLKVCYDLSGRSRPTEFKSQTGSEIFLVTYEREKR